LTLSRRGAICLRQQEKENAVPGALEGILVVALEQAVAAPLASSRLADAGARVIKLERPEGDFARGYDGFVAGQSSYFVWNNRGKQSCIVDLKTPGDRDLVLAMLEKADVFIQNLAPGATGRLGLGSLSLRARFPRLIVCDIAGFGEGTPDRDRKAYDLLVQAEAGLSAITGSAGSGPARVGISICDVSTGQAAYAAILEALFRRERTGQGSHVSLSLFDTIAEYMNVPYLSARYGGREPPRLGLAHPSIAPYGVFEARDGAILVSIQNEREWVVFARDVLDAPELLADDRFSSNNARVANRPALDGRVAERIAFFSVAEMVGRMDRHQIAYGRVSTVTELAGHRSVALAAVETPAGPAELIAPPVVVDGVRPALGRVPALGEHDAAIRAEFGRQSAAGETGA
jgi:crotonobetainyl-CoA:carnitine CoA-transferase CaiB-like acyl-CoA transferase